MTFHRGWLLMLANAGDNRASEEDTFFTNHFWMLTTVVCSNLILTCLQIAGVVFEYFLKAGFLFSLINQVKNIVCTCTFSHYNMETVVRVWEKAPAQNETVQYSSSPSSIDPTDLELPGEKYSQKKMLFSCAGCLACSLCPTRSPIVLEAGKANCLSNIQMGLHVLCACVFLFAQQWLVGHSIAHQPENCLCMSYCITQTCSMILNVGQQKLLDRCLL